jgi:hypothetical protein
MPVAEHLVSSRLAPTHSESASLPRSSNPIADANGAETVPGPVTSIERQAHWRHRGGVLELSGPAALIHAVERSLLLAGAATVRIDLDRLDLDGVDLNSGEFVLHPQLLDTIATLQTRSGLLTLLVRTQQDAALTAHTADQSILLDVSQPNFAPATAVAAVYRLLYEANILISPEWLGEGSGI